MTPHKWGGLGAGLAGAIGLAYGVGFVWQKPCASLLYFSLIPLVLLAAARILRSGAGEIALFGAFTAAAALLRMLHGSVTGCWYVDYLGPLNSTAAPEVHVLGGLTGLLRCLSFLAPVSPEAVFAASAVCSSLSVGFLVLALWRDQKRGLSSWPPYTILVWGVLLATDGTLTYLGASDAHHNVALLAFSLSLWWYGEALRDSGPDQKASTSLLPLFGVFLCSALVGLTRVELLASSVAIPFLLPASKRSYREWRQVKALAALGLGMLLAWIVVSRRDPLGQIAMFHPRTLAQCIYGLFRQSLFRADFPPLLEGPSYPGAAFLVFLLGAARFGNWKHLGLAVIYTALILPKVLGGYETAWIGGFLDDAQRYNIILIPLALFICSAGIASLILLLRTRQPPFKGARGWAVAGVLACSGAILSRYHHFEYYIIGEAVVLALVAVGGVYGLAWFLERGFLSEGARRRCGAVALACAGVWLVTATAAWARREVPPLPHQAEFAFLSQNLQRIPHGSTVVAVWLKSLNGRRDADTQLAVPHALLVHARPDLNWVAVMPGEPLPALRPLLYYKGASCSMDPAQGVTNGPDHSSDRELLKRVAVLCRNLEKMTSKWDVRRHVRVKEVTVHLLDEQLDLGLGWIHA